MKKLSALLLAVVCVVALIALGRSAAVRQRPTPPWHISSPSAVAGDLADDYESLLAPPEHPRLYSAWCPVGLEAILTDGLQRHGFYVSPGPDCRRGLHERPA